MSKKEAILETVLKKSMQKCEWNLGNSEAIALMRRPAKVDKSTVNTACKNPFKAVHGIIASSLTFRLLMIPSNISQLFHHHTQRRFYILNAFFRFGHLKETKVIIRALSGNAGQKLYSKI